jgi:hypothetical protein
MMIVLRLFRPGLHRLDPRFDFRFDRLEVKARAPLQASARPRTESATILRNVAGLLWDEKCLKGVRAN